MFFVGVVQFSLALRCMFLRVNLLNAPGVAKRVTAKSLLKAIWVSCTPYSTVKSGQVLILILGPRLEQGVLGSYSQAILEAIWVSHEAEFGSQV